MKNNYNLYMPIFSTLFKKIGLLSSRVNPDKPIFEERLRRFQFIGSVIFLISSFYNFLSGMMASFYITATAFFVVLIAYYLQKKKKTNSAFYLLFFGVNISLILLTYAEGYQSGIFLFFFVTTISFIFLSYGIGRTRSLMVFGTSILSFFTAVFVASSHPHWQIISQDEYYLNLFFNIIVSFLFVSWMAYSLSAENQNQQKELLNKQFFLDTIFNTSVYAEIVVSMTDGSIEQHNAGATNLFLHKLNASQSIVGIQACNLFAELKEEGGEELFKQMCSAEKWEGELTCIRLDDTNFPGSVCVVSFKYKDCNYKKITIIDITEKKKILDELSSAKKNAERLAEIKTQFLSNMSHELRTPLNGIIGSANLLLEDIHLPSQKEQLTVLKYSSEHMLCLINDILDLSKLDADKIRMEKIPVNIHDFIQTVSLPFKSLFHEKKVQFTAEVEGLLSKKIIADPTRLNQVLSNLLSNALKFTAKGSVLFKIKIVESKSEHAVLHFSVQDSGIGISLDNQKYIFDPFTQADIKTTRKFGGTGLGLTISQKIVNSMGGVISIESREGLGSKFLFSLTFPFSLLNEKEIAASIISGKDLKQLNGLKVLIAEDNPINMMIASKFLDKWGVGYTGAENGVEAVSIFNKDEYHALLMDLEMPLMDGYEALREIRKINPKVPAIALTAAEFENMKEGLLASGFTDYVQKPFRPQDLHAKLSTLHNELVKTIN